MDARLLNHLRRSPDVRRALKQEGIRLAACSATYVGAIVVFRYLTERPILDGFLAAIMGGLAMLLMWLISALRTVRAVLREQSML